jgi:hypothetical protein
MALSFALTKMRRAEKGGRMQCFGPLSRRCFNKLHAVVDTKGRPIHIALTPGQRHEMIMADELLEHAQGKALMGDAATALSQH